MQRNLILSLCLSVLFLSPSLYASSTPTVVEVEYERIFVPGGFDSNDNAQVVVEGVFSNSCYRPGPVQVRVEHANKTVYVHPTAFKYSGMCLEVLVPYHQVLDLGILQSGKYKIVQLPHNGTEEKLGEITIKESRSDDPDDYLYAPISQVYWTSEKGVSALQIEGEFSNSCMKLDRILVNQQESVIVVQPIAKLQQQASCLQEKVKFKRKIEVKNLRKGKYLLHVRSLNARAINALVEVE